MEIYDNTESVTKLHNFWENAKLEIGQIKTDQITFKSQELPLARIKKIMKLDEDVKSMMISAEAPILFAKAAELFIREITLRAWIHTERNKRRTLQRSDITLAVADGDTDQFDFLIDIVPRDEIKSHGSTGGTTGGSTATGVTSGTTKREETTHTQPGGSSMPQVSGISLFGAGGATSGGTATLQLTSPLSNANQPALISGLDASGSLTLGTNIIQAQPAQSTSNIQQSQQVQYVLQLPVGATSSLAGGQAIQIQMIPQQQTILTSAGVAGSGGSDPLNSATTLITSSANVSQPQQIFTIGGSGTTASGTVVTSNSNINVNSGANTGNTGPATVVLPAGILTGAGGGTTVGSTNAVVVSTGGSGNIYTVASGGPQLSTISHLSNSENDNVSNSNINRDQQQQLANGTTASSLTSNNAIVVTACNNSIAYENGNSHASQSATAISSSEAPVSAISTSDISSPTVSAITTSSVKKEHPSPPLSTNTQDQSL